MTGKLQKAFLKCQLKFALQFYTLYLNIYYKLNTLYPFKRLNFIWM